MVRRLRELYQVGDRVEIYFEPHPGRPQEASGWQAGTVVAHEHPGVWVETATGDGWFVTNRRRIRSAGR